MNKKCPKRNKKCIPSICFMTSKKNYICSGVSKKPTIFEDDIVWLCLKGKHSKTALEMTQAESLAIISVLTGSLFGIKKLAIETREE